MAGIDAFGTKWALGDGADPEVFTDVADVTKIELLSIKVDTTDVSSHDSEEQWREFIGGMKDAGELSFDINYDPALHNTIVTAQGETQNMKITLTDTGAAVVSFAAILTGFKAQAPYDDKLSATVTIKVTGKPVIAL